MLTVYKGCRDGMLVTLEIDRNDPNNMERSGVMRLVNGTKMNGKTGRDAKRWAFLGFYKLRKKFIHSPSAKEMQTQNIFK